MRTLSPLSHAFLRIFLILSITFFTAQLNAQMNVQPLKVTGLSIENNKSKKTVNIKFSVPSEVYNMLIVITDQQGNTVFLENKYRFKGEYDREIDLSTSEGTDFEIRINNDDQKINQKLTMR